MEMLKRLFGNTRQADLGTPSQFGAPPDTRMPEAESLAGTRRELVRVMARDTQRRAGIPDGWLEFQVMLEVTRNQTFVHLRIVVRHWDERLVRAQVAFQTRWLQNVERFEPQARTWIGSVSWLYPDDNDCPEKELPDPTTWSKVEHVDIEVDDVEEDLQRLFAVRDAALGSEAPADPPRPAA